MAANSINKSSKKLVQGRLPFQIIRNTVEPVLVDIADEPPSLMVENGKKKRSDSFEDDKAVKKLKFDESEIDLTFEENDTTDEEMDEEDDDKMASKEDGDDVVMVDDKALASEVKIVARKPTPKQLEKRLEAIKRREERERLKQVRFGLLVLPCF